MVWHVSASPSWRCQGLVSYALAGFDKIPADLKTTLGGIKSFPAAFLGFKETKILDPGFTRGGPQ